MTALEAPATGREPRYDLWLKPTEAARRLKVSKLTLTRWAKAGTIPSRRTDGGHRRYRESTVSALAEARARAGTRHQYPPGRAMLAAAAYVRANPGCSKAGVRHGTGCFHKSIQKAIAAGMITAVQVSVSPLHYRLYPPQSPGGEK